MKKHVFLSLFLAFAFGASAAGWPQINLNQKSSAVKISETIHALVAQNDTLFAATADGVWASPSGFGGDWVAYGLQGQEVKLLNFKVKKLAIVATVGNVQPLYERIGGVWVQNLNLPLSVAITGGVNFEQLTNNDQTLSIVIPSGSGTVGDIYKSLDGGATFSKVTVGLAAKGVNTFANDSLFYFPNCAKVVGSPEANNNQTSFYFSATKGNTFARFANSYSIATGIPANFIFKLAGANGHTYHFLGGQKDVVRLDSLGMTHPGVIPWNNPVNMKSFITNRTLPITDGATNLTTFPTHNFKKMMQANGKLYLLADSALYVSTDEGVTYTNVIKVAGDTLLTSLQTKGNSLLIGTNHGVLTDYNFETDKVNAMVLLNDSLFLANSNGIWVSPSKGAGFIPYGLQGQEVRLLNFKVKRLAIVATAGNIQPLYELVGGAWVRNTALPVDKAISGGVNFEQLTNNNQTLSIVIPSGSGTVGDIYKSLDGGATFSKVTVGLAAFGVNTFANDSLFYFPNSAKVVGSPEANNNQTSFYFSATKGNTFARFPNSYSIATGVPANFIYKLAATNGHTYHFLGGQKDVVRVDSLGMTHPGVIPWNNPVNMKCFIPNRIAPITDGATNLTTFPTYNFKKMLQTANGKLYLLADSALYVSVNEGASYQLALKANNTIFTSALAAGNNLVLGSTKGLLTYQNQFSKGSDKVNALVLQNDSLFAATEDGIWLSKDNGVNWSAYGLQGQEVKLLNFKVKKLAIVATPGNFQPLFERIGGVWVKNLNLPVAVAITGGVNFEQMQNADLTHSIVIPTGSTTLGGIYTSADGGATFAKTTPSNAFVSVGINTFDGDPNFYFPNSAKVGGSVEANNNQTSFYFSANKGATFARVANSYSIATGVPANFIHKLAASNGHTYHFLGGQKDVVRVDSLGLTHPGVIPWNNTVNMKSFITNRTVAITDGATNLTTFPTYNFKKMVSTTNSLYLLSDKTLYLSKDDGATYTSALAVGADTLLSSVVANATTLFIGTNKGVLTLAVDNVITSVAKPAEIQNVQVFTNAEGIHVAAEGLYNVTVYNLTGQVVASVKHGQGIVTIPVPQSQSIYLVRVNTGNRTQTVKVMMRR